MSLGLFLAGILVFITICLKNPVLPTDNYYSEDSGVRIYRQWFKQDRYFIKTEAEWFAFYPKEEMVFIPSSPDRFLGMYFYNFDRHLGPPITFDLKVVGGNLNWEESYFSFSIKGSKTHKIYKTE